MMNGLIGKSTPTMVYYPMDTYGGQSGSPVFSPHRLGCGVCGMAIHSYGAGGTPPMNSGPRITGARFSLIGSLASANG